MSSLVLTGDTSGQVTLAAPAVAGSNTLTLQAATATSSVNTLSTAVATTSGTSVTFSSLPAWVKRITVVFQGVSTSGTSNPLIQLGAGSVTATGYLGASSNMGSLVSSTNFTTGIGISNGATAAAVLHGLVVFTTLGSNAWAAAGTISKSDSANTITTGGSITLGGTLDRVVITTVNGTDTFDAGSVNILYEG